VVLVLAENTRRNGCINDRFWEKKSKHEALRYVDVVSGRLTLTANKLRPISIGDPTPGGSTSYVVGSNTHFVLYFPPILEPLGGMTCMLILH
jgi:hypothetical protein